MRQFGITTAVALALVLGGVAQGGLVGYWSFDSAASPFADSSGSGNHAAAGGGAVRTTVTAAAGAGGLALDRDAGSFLDLPDVSGSFANAATLSMWVKLDAATSGDNSRTGLDSLGANTYDSHYPWTNGQAYFSTFRNGSRVDGVALSPYADRTEWHHLAVTAEPGTGNYKIYQDGQLIRTADPGTFIVAPGGNIGKSFGNFWLDGAIDEVKLYNEALSPAQVMADANLGQTVVNLARMGTATQSTTAYGGTETKGNDGGWGGLYWQDDSTTHTDEATLNNWWQLDLGQVRDLNRVELFNRPDGGHERLSNFRLSVLDSAQAEVYGINVGPAIGARQTFALPVGIQGQFVKVQLNGVNGAGNPILSLNEVRVFGQDAVAPNTNLAAAYGIAHQSSTLDWTPRPPAQNAIDGNRDGNYYNGSVAHTANSATPAWYEVDLGTQFYLDRVQIFPRSDARQSSVENFRLSVFSDDGAGSPGGLVWTKDFLTAGGNANYTWGTAELSGIEGRHVRLERLDASPNFMTFAEFEVIGQTTPLLSNLALNKPVTASPGGWGAVAGDGNDGDIDGSFYNPGHPVFHTSAAGVGQFWQVDLLSETALGYLDFFNRTDANTTTQFLLQVLDDSLTPVWNTVLDAPEYDARLELGGVRGRYVRVETTQGQYLSFAEIRVFAVPEPTTLSLLGLGGLALLRRRRREA